jgi:hypothetical protein
VVIDGVPQKANYYMFGTDKVIAYSKDGTLTIEQ